MEVGNNQNRKERGMKISDEDLNEIERCADELKNINLSFQIQILKEIRELKALFEQQNNRDNGSGNTANCT